MTIKNIIFDGINQFSVLTTDDEEYHDGDNLTPNADYWPQKLCMLKESDSPIGDKTVLIQNLLDQ